MALSQVSIASAALIKVGAMPINSFNDNTAEAEIVNTLYPIVKRAILSSHPWSFATKQTSLARLQQNPIADYDSSFQLPSDFLRALSAGVGDRGQGIYYRIAGDQIHANADELNLTYIFSPDESSFPPFFEQALIAKLSAELCIPLTENTSRAQALQKIADYEFKKAKAIDSQQDTPNSFNDFSLINVRN
ncbi:MAG: hypothetical protein OIF36_00555 [Alphaproteobacteria bacterium]|jgi:hypothetical protein|nr:hypothetical protein [Alphaproteobacteria bacterium]MCV6598963.1 hypothetical protein [Alphaproteobacteria bacterium]